MPRDEEKVDTILQHSDVAEKSFHRKAEVADRMAYALLQNVSRRFRRRYGLAAEVLEKALPGLSAAVEQQTPGDADSEMFHARKLCITCR